MPIESTSSELPYALAYARHGWHVFPLVPGTKRPAVPAWQQWATTNSARIRDTWQPGARRFRGVGVACGPSGLVVVDLDVPKPGQTPPPEYRDQVEAGEIRDGADVFAALRRAHGAPAPRTFTVRTPRGGWHLYFTYPARLVDEAGQPAQLRNSAGTVGWLIDTRAHGGYVVAPPTATTDGTYRVVRAGPVEPLPAWLAGLLVPTPQAPPQAVTVPLAALHGAIPSATADRSRAYLDAAVAGELQRIHDAVEGRRNYALFIAAKALGQLVAGGALDEDGMRARLREAAEAHVKAGAYGRRQAEATIASGLKAGARQPRRLAS